MASTKEIILYRLSVIIRKANKKKERQAIADFMVDILDEYSPLSRGLAKTAFLHLFSYQCDQESFLELITKYNAKLIPPRKAS